MISKTSWTTQFSQKKEKKKYYNLMGIFQTDSQTCEFRL